MADLANDSDTTYGSLWASRKFVATLICMALISLDAVAAVWLKGAADLMGTFIGGLLGALSLYLTGNLVSQHVEGKTQVAIAATKPPEVKQ